VTAARFALAVAVLTLELAAGCVSIYRPGFAQSAPRRRWPSTLDSARSQALAGRFGAADTTLASFALKFPGTPEALETAYWRALFDMDPSNAHPAIPDAMASLDAYLTDTRPKEHLAEATTLRRIAAQLDVLTRQVASAVAQAKDATSVAANARAQVSDANARVEAAKAENSNDAEIKRLRDSLAKVNSELERIKKRLAQPPPKP
jgi:hypothetical protein